MYLLLKPLFKRISEEDVEKYRQQYGGASKVEFPLDIRVGEITQVEVC